MTSWKCIAKPHGHWKKSVKNRTKKHLTVVLELFCTHCSSGAAIQHGSAVRVMTGIETIRAGKDSIVLGSARIGLRAAMIKYIVIQSVLYRPRNPQVQARKPEKRPC